MCEQDRIISGIAFSAKEILVISELVNGGSYKTAAYNLSLSVRTVEYHVKNMMQKVGVNSKGELLMFFSNNGVFNQQHSSAYFCRYKFLFVLAFIFFSLGFVYLINNKPCVIVMDTPDFRENLLTRKYLHSKIDSILKSQDGIRIVAIAGGGGAGKTTIAREFLKHSDASISWEINAESKESIYNAFIDLAEHLSKTEDAKKELALIRGLTNIEDRKKRLVKLVSGLLKSYKNWHLLYDNVESIKNIHSYLPYKIQYWGSGNVIITTRNAEIGNVNFIKSSNVINIGLLSDQEHLKLFCDILYGVDYKTLDKKLLVRVKKFLINLPKMPLDVCAAAYYLKNTKISFEAYEDIVASSCKDLNDAQGALLEENVNYSRTRYSIISSVFETAVKENPKFKELLFLMCMMDSQNIPKSLFRAFAGSVVADKFIYSLRKNALIVDSTDSFSIHRSSQSIGFDYMLSILSKSEKIDMLKAMASALTPYKKLVDEQYNLVKIAQHLEVCLNKLGNLKSQEYVANTLRIELMLTIADICRYQANRLTDALQYFKQVLKINDACKYLDKTSEALIRLKIGEIYTCIGANNEAILYLNNSLDFLNNNMMDLAKNYRLIGIMHMRSERFAEANKYFEKAINVLNQEHDGGVNLRIAKSDVYSDMAFNYFMDGINRSNAEQSMNIMKQAIEILESNVGENKEINTSVVSRLSIHKIKLAGIYNALGKYNAALQIAQETEDLITSSKIENSDIFYVQGIIARERGLSYLRLNEIQKAYDYFMNAKKIFSKSMITDYLFKIKMHEAECLIRLNRLDEAFIVCENIFATKSRERNNYSDLFFYTCYYHAAVIKYKKNDIESTKDYFNKFNASMQELCKKIVSKEKYDNLIKMNAFKTQDSIKTYFKNSLDIFEAIYWKDYEFTKYYVEENYKSVEE